MCLVLAKEPILVRKPTKRVFCQRLTKDARRTFEFIVRLAGPEMVKKDTRLRQSIPVHKQVVVALWRLATGDTY